MVVLLDNDCLLGHVSQYLLSLLVIQRQITVQMEDDTSSSPLVKLLLVVETDVEWVGALTSLTVYDATEL